MSRCKEDTGGLPVVRPEPIDYQDRQALTLMSDLHLGAANTDEGKIHEELQEAYETGRRILIGGDLLDLILPSDRKRYKPSRIHPALRGRDDGVDAAVEYAVKFLAPYADSIDLIGLGNHETAVLKIHHTEAVKRVIQALNDSRPAGRKPILHGGYTAYVDYRLLNQKGRPAGRYVIWYHHGSGHTGSAPKALTALAKQTNAFAADLYWSGHSHTRCQSSEVMVHCPKAGERPVYRDVRCVVTGGYLISYGQESQESIEEEGWHGTYSSDAALAPHGIGGATVWLEFDRPGFPARVRVEQ